jgi:hypothetical protein
MPVSRYLALINLLLSYGPKLKLAWPKIMQVIELLRSIAADLGLQSALEPSEGGTLGLEAECNDTAVLEAESKLGQLLAADGAEAAFDGTRLRRLWKFLEDSGLDDLLISILTRMLAGS